MNSISSPYFSGRAILMSMEQKSSLSRIQKKRTCRSGRRREVSWKKFFPHARIVNDPKKLAELNAEIERRRLG
jgi:hypothetical protein